MFRALVLAVALAAALGGVEVLVEPDDTLDVDQPEALAEQTLQEELMGEDAAAAPRLTTGDGQTLVPGRATPVVGPDPIAVELLWDRYRTVLVVGAGRGRTRPAWVATFAAKSGRLAVAYRAVAFRDAQGLLHLDARRAIITGPMAREWSPDSFAIIPPAGIATIDDQNRGNQGTLSRTIEPSTDSAEYQRLLGVVQAAVANNG